LAAYSNCPLQYKFAHRLHIPAFGNHNSTFGQSMHNTLHKIMEEYTRRINNQQINLFDDQQLETKNNDLLSLKEMMQIFEENWSDDWYPSERLKKQYFEKGRDIIKAFKTRIDNEAPKVAFLEKGFVLKIKNVILKGRIDRIDKTEKGYEIIDYKAGKPHEKLAWDNKRQLIIYALAAEEAFDPPLPLEKLTYYYLDNDTTLSFMPTEKEKEKLKEEILKIANSINNGDFHPSPGYHCRNCDFKDICEFSDF
ncbi:PD-(D/E)XK nuclease family protein, partial [Candidatus Parcubacteria bacterium]